MTTNSINFLKTALAILLFSNSILLFYIFKQEQNQNKQNSELKNLNAKLDLYIKNDSENQSKKAPCLQVVIENEKTKKLEPVLINYIEEIFIDNIVTDVTAISDPCQEEEGIGCIIFYMKEAEPEKGIQSFYDYISKNIKYPIRAREKNIEGKVMVSFVVDKNGEITDVKAKNDIGGGCKEEAERIIRNSSKWNPAKQRGKSVKTRLTIPIVFKLEKE
ncbi:energy transducer TonB [Bernardetia sp. Wsw4-3y2]|uniref:energy transducer TonB n=1 Tax=Bernardetia sp. Wsw4-3y2 TaxID=3127471 RepID=UPI0030CC63BC